MAVWRWIWVGLLAILLAAPARAQNATQPAGQSSDQLIIADNSRLQRLLADPNLSPDKRDDAARRLATRDRGRPILIATLSDKRANRDIRLSAAKGAANIPMPDDEPVRAILDFAAETAQQQAIHESVIRAMGNMVDPGVAKYLIAELGKPAFDRAAADALTQMTGLPYGPDVKRWGQWQTSNAGKTPAEWIAQVKADHLAHIEQMRRPNPVDDELTRLFRGMDRQQKETEMERFLQSADPQLQLLGLRIVINLHDSAQPRPASADRLIPDLLSDGDLQVRTAAARVVHDINLVGALDAILVQLPQEVDENVKEVLADDLGPINDLRAVEVLAPLLKDQSLKVASAAARSLRMLGDAYRQKSPAGAKALANELWERGRRRAAEVGGTAGPAFLALCIEAMAPLRDAERYRELRDLCFPDPQRPAVIRVAALHAVSKLPNPDPTWFNQIVANAESDPPAVRIATIGAVADAGKFGVNAAPLFDLTKPNIEPDKSIRDDAWEAFKSLLRTATDLSLLQSWAEQLRDDPDHKRVLPVYEALIAQLAVSKDPKDKENLANAHQSAGEAYDKDGQFDKAIEHYKAALKYWDDSGSPANLQDTLVGQLEDSLLNNRKYKEACTFAADRIKKDPTSERTVIPRIVNKAERLKNAVNDSKSLEDALTLIDEALHMNPPLNQGRRSNLSDVANQAAESLAKLRQTPPPSARTPL